MFFREKSILVFFIIFSLLSLQSQCNKKFGCSENVYSFALGIKAFPDNDSLNVGDTIWLEVNEPTTLKDAQTGRMIDYSRAANLGTAIGIAELISVNTVNIEGNSFFKFSLLSGNEIIRPDTNKFREYEFAEINNSYKLKIGITALKKGIYKMFISNAANVFRTNDKCTKANFLINFIATNQHLYFNEIVLPGVALPPGGGIYLFKVK